MENIFFSILTVIMITCGLMVVLSKNPVHSILFLVLVFVCSAILLLLLNSEFISMLMVVIYIGAINILFLFIVMMLNVRILELAENLINYVYIGAFIGIIFLSLVFYLIFKSLVPQSIGLVEYYQEDIITDILSNYSIFYMDYFSKIGTLKNIEQIGLTLYTKYVYTFLLCGMILLIAMLGAIALTLNQSHKNKRQDYYIQTNRNIKDSIKYLTAK